MQQFLKPFIKMVVCPYCSTEMQLRNCKIVSGVDKTIVLDDPTQKRLRFITASRINGQEKTRQLASRLCINPNCDRVLPRNIEFVDRNVTIAIVGDSFSGKTHYITALIEQLRSGKYRPPGYNLCLLHPANAEVDEKYQQDYYQPLFKHKQELLRTNPALDQIADPLIYELTLDGQTRKVINLLIYDIQGEDVINLNNFVSLRPHLLNAKGILFMADPWAIPSFNNKLAHHLRPDENLVTGRVTVNSLYSLIQLYLSNAGQDGSEPFTSPVGVVITKADLIPYLNIDPRYHGLYNPDLTDRLDIATNSPVNGFIQKFLRSLGEPSIVDMVNKLDRSRFFVASATGSNVDDVTREFPYIRPYRCIDPLFWLLQELGVLD